jgi:hypothetical protein
VTARAVRVYETAARAVDDAREEWMEKRSTG